MLSEDEEAENDKKVAEAKLEEKREAKRKRKLEMKDKRKQRDKLQYKMVIPGDRPDYPDLDELFDLSSIKTKKVWHLCFYQHYFITILLFRVWKLYVK